MQAMKEGSVQGLDRCLQEHQIRFIQAGTYLLLEKLKNSVYRRLFRRVALLHKEQEPAKAAQVPLGASFLPVSPVKRIVLWGELSLLLVTHGVFRSIPHSGLISLEHALRTSHRNVACDGCRMMFTCEAAFPPPSIACYDLMSACLVS